MSVLWVRHLRDGLPVKLAADTTRNVLKLAAILSLLPDKSRPDTAAPCAKR